MEYEWGPWIEHDGKGCPVKGQWVQVINKHSGIWEGIAGSQGGRSWDWSNAHLFRPVIRYRVRKPRVAEWLQSIPVDIKEPVDA